MSEPLLSVRDLDVRYRTDAGDVPAVRGVSFDLAPGETLGLAGESGCGKSSVAGALLRVLPRGTVVTGEVLLDGEDVLTMRPGRLRAVRWSELSIVFQGALHSLNPVQRVGDQIAEAIELHHPRTPTKARVGELLETVGLPARRGADFPHQLSGGQRQRVLIALALACNPRILIADEPTTALDVMVQAQVLELLEKLQRELGLSMIFITHDLSTLASRLSAHRGHVRGADRGGRAERGGLRQSCAPVHGGARGGVPGDRRPVVPDAAVRSRRRPARPARAARRVPVPSSLPSRRSPSARSSTWSSGLRATGAAPPASTCSGRRRACDERHPARDPRPARALPRAARGGRARGRRRRPRGPARGGACARRRVGLREDDARADDPRARAPGRGRGSVRGRGDPLRRALPPALPREGADGLPGPDGRAQPAADGLRGGRRGAPDPEARRATRPCAWRTRSSRAGLRPPERFFQLYPVRALRRAAPARRHRGRDGARAVPARRRRAGVEPRRVGPRARSSSSCSRSCARRE